VGGRYQPLDPIGVRGGLNLYEYVYNNPLNWRDPLGLDASVRDDSTESVIVRDEDGGYVIKDPGESYDGKQDGVIYDNGDVFKNKDHEKSPFDVDITVDQDGVQFDSLFDNALNSIGEILSDGDPSGWYELGDGSGPGEWEPPAWMMEELKKRNEGGYKQ
jgi:uncharacterized protein RhaS with RHS repeats